MSVNSDCATPPRVGSDTNIHTKVVQRQRLIQRITDLRTNIHLLDSMSPYQLETKLQLVEHHFHTFERLQTELESLDESQLEVDHRTAFEDSFCEVKSAIIERISELRKVDTLSSTRVVAPSSTSSTAPRHSLPKLQLTKFSGSYTEWLDFFNMFTALVHNNAELEDIEKFQYLRSCLTHNAFRLVQSLEVTSDNYKRAIELLVTRYDNKRYIFQSHLQAIFNSKGTRSSNVSTLREFIDFINSHLRAMQSFASSTQIADSILLQLIVTKLEPDMQEKWEEEIAAGFDKSKSSSLQLPSWNDLANFIERRCQTVNIIEVSKGLLGKVTSTATATKSSRLNSTFTVITNNKKCLLCNENNSHSAFKCSKFTVLNTTQRYSLIKNNHLCFNCLGANHTASSCPSTNRCQECKEPHHTLLHRIPQSSSSDQELKQASPLALHARRPQHNVILATALVQLHNTQGTKLVARALLDSGSQLNFISERIAQGLRVRRTKVTIDISGIGSVSTKSRSAAVIEIKSLHSGFKALTEVVIMPSISASQPPTTIDITSWDIPKNIPLADNTFNVPGPIDILIGASIFFDILSVGQIRIRGGQPALQKTQLGWIVAGAINTRSALSSSSLSAAVSSPESTVSPALTQSSLDACLERFWRLEDASHHQASERTSSDEQCEAHFRQHTTRCPLTKKFIVRLPFAENPSVLGPSTDIAKRRFYAMEKRMLGDRALSIEYTKFMQEYIELKHMIRVDPHEFSAKVGTYIPHHCVRKIDSSTTKLRVVFDASCSTSNGKALNSILRVGPTLQDDIVAILLRFRTHRYVLMADIAKMYRQINVDPRDAKWQCILWRNTPTEPVTTYQLQTVTYGTSCAPFLAVRCLQQVAHENMSEYPIGATITLRDFYVDNLMTGGATIDEVNTIKTEVISLLNTGGFPLRKFASNSDDIISDVAQADREQIINVDDKVYIKALGLKWSPMEDCFMFSYTPSDYQSTKITKRTILSQVASLFDPLGLLSPIIVKGKILMQQLWQLRLSWDESVPQSIETEWKNMCYQLSLIDSIQVPRFMAYDAKTTIHAFADASGKAYGACIYAVSPSNNGTSSTLICAKSRVAPTKEVTLPRLELCAATLLAELLHSVMSTLSYKVTPTNVHCWSDSTITLSWLQREPHHWTTFVSNRVAKIQRLTRGFMWHHVPSEQNPADLVSRGATVKGIAANCFWFHGPEFLLKGSCHWPSSRTFTDDILPERRKHGISLTASLQSDIIAEHKYVNNYNKLLRIFAYINRFTSSLRHLPREVGPITASELDSSLLLICQCIQKSIFAKEYKDLETNEVSLRSPFNNLSPFLHDRIIRVGGRISNSSLPFEAKHPILLPKTHPFVRTLINTLHRRHLHAGCQTLLSILRDRFWIINARSLIRQIVHQCVLCFRNKPRLEHQIMGALPQERVQPAWPFEISGVDYCGPFAITSRIRSKSSLKVYICLFICFTTKAVHLELVPDLTTMSFIAALKRFVARRGKCKTIVSDNATNFVGANRELRELLSAFISEQHIATVQQKLAEEGIEWKFIPPRSPHFGGLWESAVKRAKYYLRRAVGSHLLNFDELHTVCCQAEAMINSRPLTPLSPNPDDLRALTPAHFLVGRTLTAITEPTISNVKVGLLKRFQTVQAIQQHFWERWQAEYIKELQQRSKWTTPRTNLQHNDLVLIKEDNVPPLKWPLGRVVDTIPGNDGIVRVVVVKTVDGVHKRAITRLSKLPIELPHP